MVTFFILASDVCKKIVAAIIHRWMKKTVTYKNSYFILTCLDVWLNTIKTFFISKWKHVTSLTAVNFISSLFWEHSDSIGWHGFFWLRTKVKTPKSSLVDPDHKRVNLQVIATKVHLKLTNGFNSVLPIKILKHNN